MIKAGHIWPFLLVLWVLRAFLSNHRKGTSGFKEAWVEEGFGLSQRGNRSQPSMVGLDASTCPPNQAAQAGN